MNEILSYARELLAHERVRAVLMAAAILLGGWLLARIIGRRMQLTMLRAQQGMIIRRLSRALILGLSVAWALSELGFDLRVVLGAAGVLTVAIGFAAQTSVSNLISGLFLMAEQPFAIGDVIRIGDTTGEVLSINSLSIRLRTFDNLMVRIPNEAVLKANVTNLTHFPIRRYDMKIGVAYDTDVSRVRALVMDLAYKNPLCLAEPAPQLFFLAFGDSALELQFSIWSTRQNFIDLRNTMHEQIKRAFDENGIEIPFPQRVLHMAKNKD